MTAGRVEREKGGGGGELRTKKRKILSRERNRAYAEVQCSLNECKVKIFMYTSVVDDTVLLVSGY